MSDGTGNIRLSSEVVVLKPFTDRIAQRVCLKCNNKFRSAGIHNRICTKCSPVVDRVRANHIVKISEDRTSNYLGYEE